MASLENLKTEGWNLSPEGYTSCVEACREKGVEPSLRHVEKVALESDLRAIGAKALSDDISRNLQKQVRGPLVLQVQKVRNVALPSTGQHHPSPSRRLLRLQLTDGQLHCSGLEVEGPIEGLSPQIPPGTKVKLMGTVNIQNGFLLLRKASLKVIGGKVEVLLKKWNLQKALPDNVDRSKTAGEGGPPSFTSFKDMALVPGGKPGLSSRSSSKTMSESHSGTTGVPKRSRPFQSENGERPRGSRQGSVAASSKGGGEQDSFSSAGSQRRGTERDTSTETVREQGRGQRARQREEGGGDRRWQRDTRGRERTGGGAGERHRDEGMEEKRYPRQGRKDEGQLDRREGGRYASHHFEEAQSQPYPRREEGERWQRRDELQFPPLQQQHGGGRRGPSERKPFNSRRRGRDREEEEDIDEDYRKPQTSYQLSDWLDIKLKANPTAKENLGTQWNGEEEKEEGGSLPVQTHHQERTDPGRLDRRAVPSGKKAEEVEEQRMLHKGYYGDRMGPERNEQRGMRPSGNPRVPEEEERRIQFTGDRTYSGRHEGTRYDTDRRRRERYKEEEHPQGRGRGSRDTRERGSQDARPQWSHHDQTRNEPPQSERNEPRQAETQVREVWKPPQGRGRGSQDARPQWGHHDQTRNEPPQSERNEPRQAETQVCKDGRQPTAGREELVDIEKDHWAWVNKSAPSTALKHHH